MLGKRFGRLVVLEQSQERRYGYVSYLCRCDCGKEVVLPGAPLRRGNYVSCGCKRIEVLVSGSKRHAASRTKAYEVWWNMKNRCERQTHRYFARYGGRGIKVCERWQDFANFLADMGQPEPGKKLERLDNDGDYEPGNCIWVDAQAQANNRSSNRIIEFDGKRMTLAEWGRETGLGRTLDARLGYGWSIERALTEPKRRW